MKAGEYARTKNGLIGKIMGSNAYDENKIAILIDDTKDIKITPVIDKEQIIKSSSKIIDLIEVGDYVNGKRVEWIGYDMYRENEDGSLTPIGEKRVLFNEFTKDSVREKGIKSIVTKEQFSSMEYKVN